MGEIKLPNDASETLKGTIYQFYVTLEKCFDLLEGECLLIEKDGDISLTSQMQMEVKKNNNDLTDADEGLWNTLNNWLDDNFDDTKYKSLILLTTQDYGSNSSFKDWNKNNIVEKKINILKEIHKKAIERQKTRDSKNPGATNSKSLVLMNSVLENNDARSNKLKNILEKFTILDNSLQPEEFFKNIKQKWCRHIYTANREIFLTSLLGIVINPETVYKNGWEISCDFFSKQLETLTSQYHSETKIFPKKYSTYVLTSEEIEQVPNHLFLIKIDEIQYHQVKNQAITEYIRYQKTLFEEMRERKALQSIYDPFVVAIEDSFNTKYRMFSRNTTEEKCIKDSKDFYDIVTDEASPPLGNFNDTPKYFKNGIIHNLANEKDIKWKLEVTINE